MDEFTTLAGIAQEVEGILKSTGKKGKSLSHQQTLNRLKNGTKKKRKDLLSTTAKSPYGADATIIDAYNSKMNISTFKKTKKQSTKAGKKTFVKKRKKVTELPDLRMSRLGTPLQILEMDDQERNLTERTETSTSEQTEVTHMEPEEFQKRMALLPFLEKLEYIDQQITKRHKQPEPPLIVESRPRSRPETTESNPEEATVFQKSLPQPLGIRISTVSDSMELPRKSPRLKSVTNSQSLGQSFDETGSETVNEDFLSAAEGKPMVPLALLLKKYPSFCSELGLHELRLTKPRPRPLAWVLRTIEEVYDAAWEFETSTAAGGSRLDARAKLHLAEKRRHRQGLMHQNQLEERDFGGTYQDIDEAEADGNVPSGLQLASFLNRFLENRLGLMRLVKQTSIDLLNALEFHREEVLEVEGFAFFLSDVYDDQAFTFYLLARYHIQTSLNLSLKLLRQRFTNLDVRIKAPSSDAVLLQEHPQLKDGTLLPFLIRQTAEFILRKLLEDGTRQHIAHAWRLLQEAQKIVILPGYLRPTADHAFEATEYEAVSVVEFLMVVTKEFRAASDEILDVLKGENYALRAQMLSELQDSMQNSERKRILLAEMELLKDEIKALEIAIQKMKANKQRKGLFLKEQELDQKRLELKQANKNFKQIEVHEDEIWGSLMRRKTPPKRSKRSSPKSPKAKRLRKGESYNTAMAIARFQMVIEDGYEKWAALQTSEKLFDGDWHTELSDLKNECAKTIQQWYRRVMWNWQQCAMARQFMSAAKQERERIIERQKAMLQILEDRKEAEKERQMNRVDELLRRRKYDQKKRNERDDMIRRHAAVAEAERRFFERNEAFTRAVLKCWWQEVLITRFRIGASSFLLLQFLRPWQEIGKESLRRKKAAIKIQSMWRVWMAQDLAQQLREKRDHLEELYLHLVQKRAQRSLQRHHHAWWAHSSRMGKVKLLERAALLRQAGERFSRWWDFLCMVRVQKDRAARRIQALCYGKCARNLAAHLRLQHCSATKIQTQIRSKLARDYVQHLRERRANIELRIEDFMQRMDSKLLRKCVQGWKLRAWQMRKVAAGAKKFNLVQQKEMFRSWQEYTRMQVLKRNKRIKRENEAALAIQRVYRGHVGRLWFQYYYDREKAAIEIQRLWRGYCTRWHYQAYLSAWHAAVYVQRVWRGFKERKVLGMRWRDEILRAAEENKYERLLFMFNNFGEWVAYEADDEGNNALHRAARGAAKRTLKLCLRMGMDINLYNGLGKTPLHLAIESSRLNRDMVASYIAEHGAWLEAPDYDGITPLIMTAGLGRAVIAETLCQQGTELEACNHEGQTALLVAASQGHEAVVSVLLRYGADCHVIGPNGWTPLHEAALDGETGIVRTLLAYGATVDPYDDEGMTPLMMAVGRNHAETVEALIEYQADVAARDTSGRRPLHLAAMEGHDEAIHALATAPEIDWDAVDAEGDTALLVAAGLAHNQVVKSLMEYGANANLLNAEGDTAVHVACRAGDVGVVEAMISYDINLQKLNWEELAPIGVARMHAKMEVVSLLEESFAPAELGDAPKLEAAPDEEASKAPVWEVLVDPATQEVLYINNETGETFSSLPEGVSENEVQHVSEKNEKALYRKVHKEVGKSEVSLAEYQEWHAKEKAEMKEARAQWWAAIKIQQNWRRKYCELLRVRILHEKLAATKIQRMYRRRLELRQDERNKIRKEAVINIQRMFRGYIWRKYWHKKLWSELWWQRAEIILAYEGQRVWRGYLARRKARKLAAIRRYGTMRAKDWQKLKEANKPFQRVFEMFEEYLLKGTPDVKFYINRVTDQGSWDKPVAWQEVDEREWQEKEELKKQGFTWRQWETARWIQALWRARQAREAFKMIIKARRMMEKCEDLYLGSPDNIMYLCNYAIFLHAIRHDYNRVRPLYMEALEYMKNRGPDNAFILYSYAIYGAVTFEEDWLTVKEMIRRAHFEDPRRKKYLLANRGFFRMAAVALLQDGESWHNYALCQYLVFGHIYEAEKAFVRAIERAPHDKKIEENFNMFIRETRPHAIVDVYDVVREHNQYIVRRVDELQQIKYAAMLNDSRFINAAIVIQRFWRDHLGQFRFASLSMFRAAQRKLIKGEEVGTVLPEDQKMILEEDKELSEELKQLGWEKVDSDDGDCYYYNHTTGESTWERPKTGQVPLPLMADGGSIETGKVSDQIEESPWERSVDEDGNEYYYNVTTGESSWERPLGYFEIDQDNQQIVVVEASDWEETVDGDGHVYWYNLKTGETSWQNPASDKTINSQDSDSLSNTTTERGDWVESEAEDGKKYFYNTATGATRWDLPNEELNSLGKMKGRNKSASSVGGVVDVVLPKDWEAVNDPESGEEFYYNSVTGETSWEKPSLDDGMDAISEEVVDIWEECVDDEGVTFYYNSQTGESQWEPPNTTEDTSPQYSLSLGEVTAMKKIEDGSQWEAIVDDETGGTYYYNQDTGETSWELP